MAIRLPNEMLDRQLQENARRRQEEMLRMQQNHAPLPDATQQSPFAPTFAPQPAARPPGSGGGGNPFMDIILKFIFGGGM